MLSESFVFSTVTVFQLSEKLYKKSCLFFSAVQAFRLFPSFITFIPAVPVSRCIHFCIIRRGLRPDQEKTGKYAAGQKHQKAANTAANASAKASADTAEII